MTDENTTQTTQSSSGQQSQSTQDTSGNDGGSSRTPTKPDYVPDTFWDGTSGAVKPEFATHYQELAALKAQHDARLAARPEKPESYELALPKDFQAPEGLNLKFDENDPRVPMIRAMAHKRNYDQAEFSELLAIEAQKHIAEHKFFADAEAAEMKKLGAAGTTRVDAVTTWLGGVLGSKERAADFMSAHPKLATHVEMLEDLQKAFTTQGGGSFTQTGRNQDPPPPPKTIEDRWYGQRKAS